MDFNSNDKFSSLVKKAKIMQNNIQKIHNELLNKNFVGKAGIDMVQISLNGKYECRWVKIKKDFFKEENKEIIEEFLASAITDAAKKIEESSKKKMSDITQSLEKDE